jgi:hypothetical protein
MNRLRHMNSARFTLILAGLMLGAAGSAVGQNNSSNTTVSVVPVAGVSANTNSTSTSASDIREHAQKAELMRSVCVNGRRHICGQVVQVTPDGLVVDSGYTDLLRAELSKSWVAPSTVTTSRPANLVEENTPGAPCIGVIFLAEIPKRPAVKLYDYVIIEAYPAGDYVYQPVPGVTKNIRRFSARLEGAVEWNLGVGRK